MLFYWDLRLSHKRTIELCILAGCFHIFLANYHSLKELLSSNPHKRKDQKWIFVVIMDFGRNIKIILDSEISYILRMRKKKNNLCLKGLFLFWGVWFLFTFACNCSLYYREILPVFLSMLHEHSIASCFFI